MVGGCTLYEVENCGTKDICSLVIIFSKVEISSLNIFWHTTGLFYIYYLWIKKYLYKSKLGACKMKNIYKRVEGPMTGSSSTNVTEGHRTHFIGVQRVEGQQGQQQPMWRTDMWHTYILTLSVYISNQLCMHKLVY